MAQKIAVASGKGGVGKSTCVVALALALKNLGKKVLMIDFDISLPSLDLIFGVSERVVNNWGDILLERCEKGDALIEKDGVSLLCAPQKMHEEFILEKVKSVVLSFDNDFDYILIDSPAGVGTFFEFAVKCADRALVISTPHDVCVRSAAAAAATIRCFGISDVRLIINKMVTKLSAGKKNLNVDAVIDETHVQLIGVVPFDENISLVSMSKNNFSLNKKPQRCFDRIARRICGDDVRLKFLR